MVSDISYYYTIHVYIIPRNRHPHANKVFLHSMLIILLRTKTFYGIKSFPNITSNEMKTIAKNITDSFPNIFSYGIKKRKTKLTLQL